jgi:hypothetical protein
MHFSAFKRGAATGRAIVAALKANNPAEADLVRVLSEAVIEQAVHVARVVDECAAMKETVRRQREEELDYVEQVASSLSEMGNILKENDFLKDQVMQLLKEKKGKLKEMRQRLAVFERRTVDWRQKMKADVRISRMLTKEWAEDLGAEYEDEGQMESWNKGD